MSEKQYIGPQNNAGSVKKKIEFELRVDNEQQAIDMVCLMTTVGNLYAEKHSCDATVRDHNFAEAHPNAMSKPAKKLARDMRVAFDL